MYYAVSGHKVGGKRGLWGFLALSKLCRGRGRVPQGFVCNRDCNIGGIGGAHLLAPVGLGHPYFTRLPIPGLLPQILHKYQQQIL